ncbi:E3 ubiquitin-protein ligase RNF169 [Podarcis raffonei]|uniref:E3 ubiquitin-protein ligase RNF169 n=1 Tax=Podarcis raffonei TaxID=65483 RepID=UPI0023292BD6|nr:E3 ubiquitin-protein ligase RNF169 [Podarcis raffonei]
MAAAAASAAALGVRAAGSPPPPPPLLRRGRGRRRRRQGGPEEKEAAAEGGGPRCAYGPRRCPPQGPGRPFCRSRLGSFSSVRAPSEGETPPPPPPPPPAQAERDFIFRAPITLSKPGELHEEYKSQLRKLRDEKLQEERTSDDFIHKLIVEDTTDAGKRKTEDQKKEESLMVKMTQERFPERLSDSENEEPFQGKSAHRSAFVSKGSTYSIALVAESLSSKVERSQSCNDTLRERSKSRQRSAPVRTKINQLSGAPAPLAGVLSSTQNNRCLSAPDLTADKRLVFHAAASFSVLQKPERSISPESNDSISEELNHFKPIVCSPCTPPKQLPDGGVLSPLIIKSTPRNLTRSLQKPTTYEASPRILKKWEQIFQERQVKKTLSKATLTSLAPEAGEDFLVPSANSLVKEPLQISNDVLPPETITHVQAATDCSPSVCVSKFESSGNIRRDLEAVEDHPKAPVARHNENNLNTRISEVPSAKAALRQTETCLNIDAKMVTRKVIRVSSEFPENGALGPSVKAAGRKQLKYLNESERSNFPNGVCIEKALGDEASPLRRGRKRQCKMKHLEQAGSVKRLRQVACHHGALAAPEPPRKRRRSEMEQRLKQEEEDRRLALQLQRKFDSENRTVARRKGRADQYFLRSKSTTGAK